MNGDRGSPLVPGLSRRQFLGYGLGALGGTALLAACGNANPSGGGGGGTTEVNVVNAASTEVFAMQHVLDQKGWLKQFGVAANTKNVASGTTITSAIVSGQGDIAVLNGFGQVYPAVEKGAPLRILAAIELGVPSALFSANPAIKTVEDLKGKTIGTGAVGALQYQIAVAVLKKHGISPNQVTFVNVGSLDQIFKAVVAKKVDAGAGDVGNISAENKFGVHVVAEVWKELPSYVNQGAYTSLDAIKNKRQALVGVLAAYAKLFQYLNTSQSKQDFVNAWVASGGTQAEGAATWEFEAGNKTHGNLELTQSQSAYMQQLNIETAQQHKLIPYSNIVDLSLVKEAVKRAGT